MGVDIFKVQPHVVSRDLRGYSFLIYGGVKFGKALYDEAVLPTPNGDKKVKDVQVGDYLFDRCGNPTKVTGVFPQGTIPAYKVIFEDDREVICNDEHIWWGKNKENTEYHEILTKDLKNGDEIPINKAVFYPDKELPIEPYKYGYLLGKYAVNSYIPKVYLQAGNEQRIQLLKGMLKGNNEEKVISESTLPKIFKTDNNDLLEDFLTLIRSLGYNVKDICIASKEGNGIYNTFIVEIDYSNPVVKDVVPLEKDLPMTCFLVDNDEHLFLANDFIVTHNTTFIAKCKKHLLLATEPGYKALPGVMALPITKWSEMKQVVKQLRKPEAHDMYEVIGIDTADLAYQYCSKYICDNEGVDTVADIPYGKGYGIVAVEFDNLLREIINLGYGLILTSHEQDKVFKDEAGIEFNKIVPTLDKRGKLVCERLVDVLGYGRIIPNKEGQEERKLFLRGTTRFEAGARFKYIVPCIDMGYKNLANAVGDAIEEEAKHVDDDSLFTDEQERFIPKEEINFDEQKEIFDSMVARLIEDIGEEAFATEYAPKISDIVEKHLGRGKKVSQATRSQVEALVLINGDLHDLLTDTEEDNG